MRKVAYADVRAVEDTVSQLDVAVLSQVVAAVDGARRIDVYGVGAGAVVGLDLQQKFHRIGRLVHTWSDAHVMLTSAALLGPDDVAVGLSHSGHDVEVVDALELAGRRGATTVADELPALAARAGGRPRPHHRGARDHVPLRERWPAGSRSSPWSTACSSPSRAQLRRHRRGARGHLGGGAAAPRRPAAGAVDPDPAADPAPDPAPVPDPAAHPAAHGGAQPAHGPTSTG